MPKLVRSSRAELDLIEVWIQLARHSESAANRALELIERRCDVLLQFPYAGEACPQFGVEMRWFPAGNHVIFYRPVENGIQVVRVIDGRRDLPVVFWE